MPPTELTRLVCISEVTHILLVGGWGTGPFSDSIAASWFSVGTIPNSSPPFRIDSPLLAKQAFHYIQTSRKILRLPIGIN